MLGIIMFLCEANLRNTLQRGRLRRNNPKIIFLPAREVLVYLWHMRKFKPLCKHACTAA